MTDQEAVKFVKEYAEIYHSKPITEMSEGEKDEVVVPFREDSECYLFGRIYPFDDEDEPIFEDGIMFQVECNYHIEDYGSYNLALEVYNTYVNEKTGGIK
jgi:hypothetical protein